MCTVRYTFHNKNRILTLLVSYKSAAFMKPTLLSSKESMEIIGIIVIVMVYFAKD